MARDGERWLTRYVRLDNAVSGLALARRPRTPHHVALPAGWQVRVHILRHADGARAVDDLAGGASQQYRLKLDL